MNTMKKKNNWISAMITAFEVEETANPKTVGAVVVGRQVSVMYLDTNSPKIGVAKCNSTDTFDLATGLAIAYARANGKTIPDYVIHDSIPFGEVKIGTYFDYGDFRYIKVDEMSAYCYNDGKAYRCGRHTNVIIR